MVSDHTTATRRRPAPHTYTGGRRGNTRPASTRLEDRRHRAHTGRDRKTIGSYLNGTTTPGVRKRSIPDPFEVFLAYVTTRLIDDPHLWVRTLCDELEDLGYSMSCRTLHRKIREFKFRPICQACLTATDRPNAVIDRPPGEETQWDWVDLPNPPASWGWGSMAHLFVGTLACSGKWRGVLAPNMTQPHAVDGLDRICRGLGSVSRVWRFDRMATVCHPDSGRVTASLVGVAKHYGVSVAICPPRRGNRKGAVEKSDHTVTASNVRRRQSGYFRSSRGFRCGWCEPRRRPMSLHTRVPSLRG